MRALRVVFVMLFPVLVACPGQEEMMNKIRHMKWGTGDCYMTHPFIDTKAKMKSFRTGRLEEEKIPGVLKRRERRGTEAEIVEIFRSQLAAEVSAGRLTEAQASEQLESLLDRTEGYGHGAMGGAWGTWEPIQGLSGFTTGQGGDYTPPTAKHDVSVAVRMGKQQDGREHLSLVDSENTELVTLSYRPNEGIQLWSLTGGRFGNGRAGHISYAKRFGKEPMNIVVTNPSMFESLRGNRKPGEILEILRLFDDETGELVKELRGDDSTDGIDEHAPVVFLSGTFLSNFEEFSGENASGTTYSDLLRKNGPQYYRFTDYSTQDIYRGSDVDRNTIVLLAKHPESVSSSNWVLMISRRYQPLGYVGYRGDDADREYFTCFVLGRE
jgi:hypothetical protein